MAGVIPTTLNPQAGVVPAAGVGAVQWAYPAQTSSTSGMTDMINAIMPIMMLMMMMGMMRPMMQGMVPAKEKAY